MMYDSPKRSVAKLLLDWEWATRRAAELEAAIKDTVRQIGESQTAGWVVAALSDDGSVTLYLEDD